MCVEEKKIPELHFIYWEDWWTKLVIIYFAKVFQNLNYKIHYFSMIEKSYPYSIIASGLLEDFTMIVKLSQDFWHFQSQE